MSQTETIIIEANRLNSVQVPNGLVNAVQNVQINNSTWTNTFAPITLNPGDTVSLNNAIINQVGTNSDVIEITGDNIIDRDYTDNNAVFGLSYYINHNAINSVVLPFTTQPQKLWEDLKTASPVTGGFVPSANDIAPVATKKSPPASVNASVLSNIRLLPEPIDPQGGAFERTNLLRAAADGAYTQLQNEISDPFYDLFNNCPTYGMTLPSQIARVIQSRGYYNSGGGSFRSGNSLTTLGFDNICSNNRLGYTDCGRYTKMDPKFFPYKTSKRIQYIQNIKPALNGANGIPSAFGATSFGVKPAGVSITIADSHTLYVSGLDDGSCPLDQAAITSGTLFILYPPNGHPTGGAYDLMSSPLQEIAACTLEDTPVLPGAFVRREPLSRTIWKIELKAGHTFDTDVYVGSFYAIFDSIPDAPDDNIVPMDESHFKVHKQYSQHLFPATYQDPDNIANKITLDFHRTITTQSQEAQLDEPFLTITPPSIMQNIIDGGESTGTIFDKVIKGAQATTEQFMQPQFHLNKTASIVIPANGINQKNLRIPIEELEEPTGGFTSPPDAWDLRYEIYPQILVRDPESWIGGAFLNNCDVYNLLLDADINNNISGLAPWCKRADGFDGAHCAYPVIMARTISGNTPIPFIRPEHYFSSDGGQAVYTNIKFTEENVRRVAEFLRRKEEYIGESDSLDQANKEIDLTSDPNSSSCWEAWTQLGRTADSFNREISTDGNGTPEDPPAWASNGQFFTGPGSSVTPVGNAQSGNTGDIGLKGALHPPWMGQPPLRPLEFSNFDYAICPTLDGEHNGSRNTPDRKRGTGGFNVRTRYDDRMWNRLTYSSNATADKNDPLFVNNINPVDGAAYFKMAKKADIAFYPYQYRPVDPSGVHLQPILMGYFINNSAGNICGLNPDIGTEGSDEKQIRIKTFNYFGFSPSFLDNLAIMPINRDLSYDASSFNAGGSGVRLTPRFWGGDPQQVDTDANKPIGSSIPNGLYTSNYLNIGANDMKMVFDTDLSRYSLASLHTPRRIGFLDPAGHDPVTGAPTGSIGDEVAIIEEKIALVQANYSPPATNTPKTEWAFMPNAQTGRSVDRLNTFSSSKAHSVSAYELKNDWRGWIGNGNDPLEHPSLKGNNFSVDINIGISDSICGVFIESILFGNKGYDNENVNLSNNNIRERLMVTASPTNWNGSLLFKLGFGYSDFFPDFSYEDGRSKRFNTLTYGNTINKNLGTKPLTTNSNVTISDNQSLNLCGTRTQMINTVSGDVILNPVGSNYQNHTMGFSQLNQVNFTGDATLSASMVASNLIRRASNAFFRIYTDIDSPYYVAGNENSGLNCIGIALKNYSSNDFYYSYSPGYTIIINKPTILSSITTSVRNADGRQARLSSSSCVMYQISRAYSPGAIPSTLVSLTDKLLIGLIEILGKDKVPEGLQNLINTALGVPETVPVGQPVQQPLLVNNFSQNSIINPDQAQVNPLVIGSNFIAGGFNIKRKIMQAEPIFLAGQSEFGGELSAEARGQQIVEEIAQLPPDQMDRAEIALTFALSAIGGGGGAADERGIQTQAASPRSTPPLTGTPVAVPPDFGSAATKEPGSASGSVRKKRVPGASLAAARAAMARTDAAAARLQGGARGEREKQAREKKK